MKIELLVLADDLTGALDTGVQFAARGAKTRVLISHSGFVLSEDANVVVVNTDSRNVPPAEAHQRVYRVARKFYEAGVRRFYKKTDSVLRGNVAEELLALKEAVGAKAIAFVPAYPRNGRITRGGVQYLYGTPVDQSSFADDPASPVKEASVPRLLKEAFPGETHLIEKPVALPENPCGALIFDAETEEDLAAVLNALSDAALLDVAAGCAGFAAHLPIRAIPGAQEKGLTFPPYFILSGSLSRVTLDQLADAGANGVKIFRLTPEQLLGLESCDGVIRLCSDALRLGVSAAVTSALVEQDAKACMALAKLHGLGAEQVRAKLQKTLARVYARIETGAGRVVIGGDALTSVIRHTVSLAPIREIEPGFVLSRTDDGLIITKSGGFGDANLLTRLCKGEYA